jgi:hypothetical protein
MVMTVLAILQNAYVVGRVKNVPLSAIEVTNEILREGQPLNL